MLIANIFSKVSSNMVRFMKNSRPDKRLKAMLENGEITGPETAVVVKNYDSLYHGTGSDNCIVCYFKLKVAMSFGKKYRSFFDFLFLLLTKFYSSTFPNNFSTAWSR